jgi:hypothetical protein
MQPTIAVKDMAQVFDIVGLLRYVDAPGLCHRIENALFVFTMAIALKTGRYLLHEQGRAAARAASNMQSLHRQAVE